MTETIKFNYLTLLERVGQTKNGTPLYSFQCECGNIIIRQMGNIKAGSTKSCGCQKLNLLSKAATKHGFSRTSEYTRWTAMISRCTNPNNKQFKDYGGRGITVCERWQMFENYFKDMGTAPPDATVERRDNNSGYSPENCYWATYTEQGNNKRNNRILEFDNQSLTIAGWSRLKKIKRHTIAARLRMGWSIEKALTTPVRRLIRSQINP